MKTTKTPATSTKREGRTWRELFPTYAEHGVTRTMVPVSVRIVRDTEWNEYRCELWTDGAHRVNADFYTDDTGDALGTAAAMLRIAVQQHQRDATHARTSMLNAVNAA